MKITDHQTVAPSRVPQDWAPSPEEFARLQAEAVEAVKQVAAGQPITEEQGDLILWSCSPLPELYPPRLLAEGLKG